MKPTELLALLQECYRDKAELRLQHVANAQVVSQYEFNNTYQYIVAREDVHLSWLRAAIEDLGGVVQEPTENAAPPSLKGKRKSSVLELFADDAARAQAFVDTWRPQVEAMTNARHQGMLRVILGETLEHKRFFEQALAGRVDLLGRGNDGVPAPGHVLPTRWTE